jgi:hypothetical protein
MKTLSMRLDPAPLSRPGRRRGSDPPPPRAPVRRDIDWILLLSTRRYIHRRLAYNNRDSSRPPDWRGSGTGVQYEWFEELLKAHSGLCLLSFIHSYIHTSIIINDDWGLDAAAAAAAAAVLLVRTVVLFCPYCTSCTTHSLRRDQGTNAGWMIKAVISRRREGGNCNCRQFEAVAVHEDEDEDEDNWSFFCRRRSETAIN